MEEGLTYEHMPGQSAVGDETILGSIKRIIV